MRRKILVVVLCGVMAVLFAGTAMADVNFNVDDYTEDELIDILQIINNANSQLGYLYSSDVLVVGQDIPAGIYEFWVEEEDIGFSQEMIDQDLHYHCGFTELCVIEWGNKYGKYKGDDRVEIYNDEYGVHKLVTLEEGKSLWTFESYGANYIGLRMKYVPDRKSGLFSN